MARSFPSWIRSFKQLILWLAEQHHDGSVSQISVRIGASVATANFWARGAVRRPSLDNLKRLCAEYSLDLGEVMALF